MVAKGLERRTLGRTQSCGYRPPRPKPPSWEQLCCWPRAQKLGEGWGREAWNGVRLSCLFRSPAQEGGGSVWLLGAPQPHPCPVWRREGSVYWVIHTRFLSHRAQCSFPSESHTPVVSVRSFFPCLLPSMRHRVPQAPKAPLALPSSLLTVRGAASPHAPLNCDYQVSTLIT